jgi:hypothetical protein
MLNRNSSQSMMQKEEKKEEKKYIAMSQNKVQRGRDHTTRSTYYHVISFPHPCTS